jgi:DNA modification methylase
MAIRDRIKRLDRVKASSLHSNPLNWRTHPKAQRDALSGILGEIGYADALLVRELPGGDLEIVDGHLRAETTPDEIVPVLVLDLDEDEAKKLLTVLDPLAAMAEANKDALAQLLLEVDTEAAAVRDLLDGLAAEHGIDLFEAGPEEDTPEAQIDRAEELQAEWKVERGQVWEIVGKAGTHRLLCGDSTSDADVKLVMGVARAGLMNTDPPYGIAYSNESVHPNSGPITGTIVSDELTDEALQVFLEKAFIAATKYALKVNAAWYMWHAHLTQGYFAAAAAAADVILHRQIIWVKPVLVFGRGQYHQKHEPCFMGWVKGHQPPDYGEGNGERTQTTVWEIGSVSNADRREYNHSTPKPVGLFTIPIVKHLKRGEACYEPFAGSGPQFVAAEQLGRVCYGIEIEPKYCAVILQRLTDMGLETMLSK